MHAWVHLCVQRSVDRESVQHDDAQSYVDSTTIAPQMCMLSCWGLGGTEGRLQSPRLACLQ